MLLLVHREPRAYDNAGHPCNPPISDGCCVASMPKRHVSEPRLHLLEPPDLLLSSTAGALRALPADRRVWRRSSRAPEGRAPARLNEKWHTIVVMSNLIAKIRHWLHLDKKPKT